jgi:outer membrane protein TolC
MKMIREGNHELLSAARSVEAAYYAARASVAPQRPTGSLSASASYVTDQQTNDSHNRNALIYSTSAALSQRFDISGKYGLDERQQILYYETRRADFDAAVNSLLAAAEGSYWSAVLARENVELQRDVLRQRRENHRVTEEKYNRQLVPRLDIVRSDAQVVAAESLVTEAEALYNNLLYVMFVLTGGRPVVPAAPLVIPTLGGVTNAEDGLERALRCRPDVRSAKLALERSEVVAKLAAKGLTPTLTGTIQWTPWSDPYNAATPQKNQLGANLTINIPVFDGGAARYNKRSTAALAEAADETLRAVLTKTAADLATAFNDWQKASVLEQDKKRQIERSDEELRITELMYNEGIGAQIDLINAQTDNQQVRTDYLVAVKDMYAALVSIRMAMGDYAPEEPQ